MSKLRSWIRRRFSSGIWNGWAETAYNQERYLRRLLAVQEHLSECLDTAPHGPVRIVSICAGDGRDVIGVLGSHPRRNDVSAWLIEQNRRTVSNGLRQISLVGLENSVQFLNQDASAYATYKDLVPADIVLVCGVWGHVPARERFMLVRAIASICKPGGTVIWTRSVAKGMNRLHEIQSCFAESTWEKVRVSITSDKYWAVVTHCNCGPPSKLPDNGRIFHFRPGAGTRTRSV